MLYFLSRRIVFESHLLEVIDMSNYIGNGGISLHDCRATKIETDPNSLRLIFPDGVWLLEDNSLNTVGKTVRTGRAEVTLKDFEFGAFTVFKPVNFFGRSLFSACREVSLEALRESVNSGKRTLEFVDDYENADSHLFRVMLWKKQKWSECFLEVIYTDAEYHFDRIEKDRVW